MPGQNRIPILTHQRMIDYLNEAEPKLMLWLANLWENQATAITYKEIRDMLFSGLVARGFIEQWQQDYAKLIDRKIKPAYLAAMEHAANELRERYPKFVFDRHWWGVHNWIMTQGTNLAVELSSEQHRALQTIIGRAATLGIPGQTVDELSRAIRPIIGLNSRFANAAFNYYNKLVENGVKPERARDLQFNYAARLHRYRAMMIARTELATAYVQGAEYGIEQAQRLGYMGEVQRYWSTAEDERTCPKCAELDNHPITKDQVPPLHPHCRCSVIYKETENALPTREPNRTRSVEELYPGEIENDPKLVDWIPPQERRKKLFEYAEEIRDLDREVCYTITKTGRVYRAIGGESNVDPSTLGKLLKGATEIHNHPTKYGEAGGSFSREDLLFHVANLLANSIVADRDFTYHFRVDGRVTEVEFERLYADAITTALESISDEDDAAIKNGEMMLDWKHYINKRLSEIETKIKYERVKKDVK